MFYISTAEHIVSTVKYIITIDKL